VKTEVEEIEQIKTVVMGVAKVGSEKAKYKVGSGDGY